MVTGKSSCIEAKIEIFYQVAPNIIFILGIVNLLTGFTIFFSCRCLPTSKIGKGLMQKGWYKNFYQYHCLIWKIFWPSVIIHAILAIVFFGIPL